jgi:hypothetical protein
VSGTGDQRVIWSLPVSGGATISSTGLFHAPATAGSSFEAIVQATSRANTNSSATAVVTLVSRISGTVNLEDAVNTAQTVTFEFRPNGSGTAATFTTTLGANGSFSLTGVEPGNYNLAVKGAKWLRKVIPVNASGGNVSGVTLTLRAGDINGDNSIDILDLDALLETFDLCQGAPGYIAAADINCDNCVDILDLDLMLGNLDTQGDS